MKGILVIENDLNDFECIEDILQCEGYKVYPEKFDDFMPRLLSLCNNENQSELKNTVIKIDNYIHHHIKEFKPDAIICDLKLSHNGCLPDKYSSHGALIIDLIRDHINDGDTTLAEFIPIIAFTGKKHLATGPVSKGVAYVPKFFKKYGSDPDGSHSDKLLFLARLDYLINDFSRNRNIVEILKPTFDEYKKQLAAHNKLVEAELNNVVFLIKGNQEEILSHLELIFFSVYQTLDKEKKQKFKVMFNEAIKTLIGDDKYEEISKNNESTWKEFQEAFSNLNNAQGFSVFTNTVVDLLKEEDLLKLIPGGNIAGIALKGVVALLSSAGRAIK